MSLMDPWKRRLMAVVGGLAAVLVVQVSAQASVGAVWSPQTSPGAYDFGQTTPGTPLSKTFHLTNPGTTKTAALRISITGGSGVFKKMRDTCRGKSLAQGQSCLVRVTYAPTSSGASDTATLAATNTAGTTTYASLALSGSTPATPPNLVIAPTTSPDLFDFGTASGTQDFTVTNNGGTTAEIHRPFRRRRRPARRATDDRLLPKSGPWSAVHPVYGDVHRRGVRHEHVHHVDRSRLGYGDRLDPAHDRDHRTSRRPRLLAPIPAGRSATTTLAGPPELPPRQPPTPATPHGAIGSTKLFVGDRGGTVALTARLAPRDVRGTPLSVQHDPQKRGRRHSA